MCILKNNVVNQIYVKYTKVIVLNSEAMIVITNYF